MAHSTAFVTRAERGHEAVAHRLDLGAAVLLQDFAGDALVLAEDRAAALVAEAGHHLRVPDEVGEEHGAEGNIPRRFCQQGGHAIGFPQELKAAARRLIHRQQSGIGNLGCVTRQTHWRLAVRLRRWVCGSPKSAL